MGTIVIIVSVFLDANLNICVLVVLIDRLSPSDDYVILLLTMTHNLWLHALHYGFLFCAVLAIFVFL